MEGHRHAGRIGFGKQAQTTTVGAGAPTHGRSAGPRRRGQTAHPRAHAANHCRGRQRSLLQGRHLPKNRYVRKAVGRLAGSRRSRRTPFGLGRAHKYRLPRRDRVGVSSERAGHRRPDGAQRGRRVRHCGNGLPVSRPLSLPHRIVEAGVRGRAAVRCRSPRDRRANRRAAVQRVRRYPP